jgi:uncharacterized membrane protein
MSPTLSAVHDLFTSGRIVDVVLAVIALEVVAVAIHRRVTGRGIAVADLLANLASGICLLVALRAALTGQSWVWVAAALSASLVGHLLDLSRRLHLPASRGSEAVGGATRRDGAAGVQRGLPKESMMSASAGTPSD